MAQSAEFWDVKDKLCLVTGATGGIGHAVATDLARRGARVLAVARDGSRGTAAAERIGRAVPGAQIDVLTCDLSRLRAVRELAATVLHRYPQLDVLVNNAAVVMFERVTTEDGFETSFAVNHLAPFLLTNELIPALKRSGQARVVTVTSDQYKRVKSVPWDDLQGEHVFKPLQTYNRTKLYNAWFTRVLAEKVAGSGVTANCASPGFVRTGLARNARGAFAGFIRFTTPFQTTPEKGAGTPVHLVTSPDLSAVNGAFFSNRKQVPWTGLASDDQQARRLWQISAQLCVLPANA